MALNSQLTRLIYSGSMKVLLTQEKQKNRKAVGCGMVFSSFVYKRYVSVRLGTLSQSFIQDQRRSTKHKLKNISRCHSSKLFQETCIQRLAVWKRCDLLVQFLFSNLMASDQSKSLFAPTGAFRNCLSQLYFKPKGRGIGYSFQLAITAPLYSIIGYCIATAQS